MVWCRIAQDIKTLIDSTANNNGKPEIRIDSANMTFNVTQTYDVKCVCDIFVCKFEPTINF